MTVPRVDCDALAAVYGDGVASYDAIWSPVILPPALAVVDALELQGATRVLDVGAGTGALTYALRDRAPDAVVVSIDRSQAMLRHAHATRQLIACVADATVLPVAKATVDAVLLAYVLFHLLEPSRGLKEAARVVRAGGQVGSVTWASETAPRAGDVWNETLDELAVPVLPAHGNHSGLETEAAIDELHREAGLLPVRVWRESIEHVFTPERFWEMRTGGGCNRARIAALPQAQRQPVLEEVRRRLGELDPDKDYAFRGDLICAVSLKT